MPSLKPNRLRGVACVAAGRWVRPKPSWDQRIAAVPKAEPGQVADGVHGDLGVVGARLHAEVTVAARRVELVGREVREPLERGRSPVCEPEPVATGVVTEEPGPEAEGQGEPGRGQPVRLPGVAGRCVSAARLAVADRPTGGQQGGRGGPPLEQRHELARGPRW